MRLVRSIAVVLLGAGLGALGASCGDDTVEDPKPTPTDPLVARGGRLYDAEGREVLFRGINARVEGLFDVTFDDGRVPLEEIPVFTGEDCRFLAEELGMNHLRLPVNWSGIEPQPDAFDEAYLAQITDLAAACAGHGVLTLVDLHQDAYSKEIGEDGAPLWAIVPPPEELLEGPLTDLEARRTSPAVLAAFDSLYNDVEGVRAEYAEMAAWLARGIEGKPGILGLELMNEPVLLLFPERLDEFHAIVGGAVREAAPTLTLFFEPNSTRNLTDDADVIAPIPFDDAVYSPHVYVDVFEDGWASEDVEAIRQSVSRARSEADEHGAALYAGEFGHAPDERGQRYVRAAYDTFDDELASAALWLYEEGSQGSWGLYDIGPDGAREGLRENVADEAARPCPRAVSGELVATRYDHDTRTLTVTIANATDGPHELAAPRRVYPDGAVARCDGTPVASEPALGAVRFACAGTTLTLAPE